MSAPSRPTTLAFEPFGVHQDLIDLDHWICWRWKLVKDKNGKPKWTKVPVNARTGELADATEPADWSAFAIARNYYDDHRGEVDGLGYCFGADDPFCGVDFDKCRDPQTGAIAPWAWQWIARFDGFAEVSVRGEGAHAIVRASMANLPGNRHRTGGFEIYDRDRFFVVTGHVILTPERIPERQPEIDGLYGELFPPEAEAKPPTATAPESLAVDDRELFQRCLGNEKFRRLHHGDDSDYGGDTSSGDLAYANIVVRNGGTAEQIDALYRQSGRAREKWDSRRGDSTYGQWTIARALDGTIAPFGRGPRLICGGVDPLTGQKPQDAAFLGDKPPGPGVNPQDAGLPGDELPDDIASLKAIVIDLRTRVVAAEARAAKAEVRLAAAETRTAMLSTVQSKTTSMLRNSKLGQERFTAVALSYRFANRESAGDRGEDGLYRFKLKDVAKEAGVSEDTAATHINKLVTAGVLKKEHRWCPDEQWVDRETGELHTGVKGQFIGPVGNVVDFIEAVAKLEPEKPKKWGGAPDRCNPCPDHPNAKIVKRTVWTCADCGKELMASEPETIEPTPHDAGMVDDDLAATGTESPSPWSSYPPRGYPSTRHRSGPSSHNNEANEQTRRALNTWDTRIPASPPPDLGVPF
jgi:hypothetical protein